MYLAAEFVRDQTGVIRQMFGDFRLWFAAVERPKSEREIRSRQLATLRGCRSLSLAEEFLVVHAGASRGRSPWVAAKFRSRDERYVASS